MWQYTITHKLPCVVDYVRGIPAFAVHFLTRERIEGFIFDMQPQTQFNPASYAVSMSEFGGFARRAFDKLNDRDQVLGYSWNKVGKGSFADFEMFAKYAVDRLPMLTKEIFLDGVDVIDDVPDNELVSRENCSKHMRTINWRIFDSEMFRDFYRSFVGVVKRRRGLFSRERFSREQADSLLEIVGPLVKKC